VAREVETDAIAHQAKPDNQIGFRLDTSITSDISHGGGGVARVDKVGWDTRLGMILPFMSNMK
jgi:hypothetical protein